MDTPERIGSLWNIMVEWLAFEPDRLLEPEVLLRLRLQALLLIGPAFFSSPETALFSLSRLELRE